MAEVTGKTMGTITKALELLNYFSRSKPEIGLGEFVRLTGRDKATVHRHLVELEQNGFLDQHPQTRAYRLGPALLRLSGVREVTHPMRSVLRPIVTALATDLGELVHVSLLQGRALSPVFHHDPAVHGTQVHFDEAEMLPLHATSSGLAVLAFSDPALVKSIVRRGLEVYTERTIADPMELERALRIVRSQGTSIMERAFDDEVSSQGAPVFGPEGIVAGALSVAVPSVRTSNEKARQIEEVLKRGVLRVTEALGGKIPEKYKRLWQVLDNAA